MVRRILFPFFVALISACALFGSLARSQTVVNTGTISGTVYDKSGGVVPGATVTLKATSTEFTQSRTATADGTFLFPALPVGQYLLTVKAAGFRTSEIREITVRVGQSLHVDAHLQPGVASSTNVVSAPAALLRA